MALIPNSQKCRKCGHRCHCDDKECERCVNDPCTGCNCEESSRGDK